MGALYDFFVNFDLDRYTTPYVPKSVLPRIPRPVSHFLGYRAKPFREPPALVQWISMIIATVGGLCVVSATFVYAPGLQKYNPPIIIASVGASAVLEYNAIRSPLAQPRNSIIGHTISAIMGVAVAKLFMHNPDFESINWVSGAVGCACASLMMSITDTTHPPGGATALLASTQSQIVSMGWWYVPFVLIASCEMVGVALVVNNLFRQYPMYWWTASDCGHKLPSHKSPPQEEQIEKANEAERRQDSQSTASDSDQTLHKEISNDSDFGHGFGHMLILPYKVELPLHMNVTDEESRLLERLQQRLRTLKEVV